MPAALCGVYGLKPTYGRIPSTGGALLSWSLDHLGPLGRTLDDIAVFYNVTAGYDPADVTTHGTPKPELVSFEELPDPSTLRFAWCEEFADDAEADVRHAFHEALDQLVDAGVTIEKVDLSMADSIQRVGFITIAAEGAASQKDFLRDHRKEYNLDTRLLMAVAEQFTAVEYLNAQRIRQLIVEDFQTVCGAYDAFVNPTLACTAKTLSKAATTTGEVNTVLNDLVSRYTFAGTLTGFPGLSVPCGTGDNGMPVGFHLTTSPWSERRLLRIAKAIEHVIVR